MFKYYRTLTPFQLGLTLITILGCTTPPRVTSDHFDGHKFFNPETEEKSLGDLIKWQWNRQSHPWPEVLPNSTPTTLKPLPRLAHTRWGYTFINHSTVLIQIDGKNILTDPIFSMRASPVSWAGPKRHRPPGLNLEELPPIDLILLSHNHYDHMDQDTLKFLAERDQPLIVTGLGNKNLLLKWGFKNVYELDWDQDLNTPPFTVTFVRAQHFSARSLWDRNQTLWGGFMLKTSKGYIYFAGDTGYGPFFAPLAQRFQPIILSLIPIGAYEPRWFMKTHHINPDEAVKIHQELKSKYSLGIHWGTFQLTDEAWDQPVIDLNKSLETVSTTEKRLSPFVIQPEGQFIEMTP